MRSRVVLLTICLSLVLFLTKPGSDLVQVGLPTVPPATTHLLNEAPPSFPSDEAVLAGLSWPGASGDEIEAAIVARLNHADAWDKEVPGLLRALGRPTAGTDATRTLIRWIEYKETDMRLVWAKRPQGFHIQSEESTENKPAIVALMRVGIPAVPHLVDEYAYFFENTQLEAWKGRWATTLVCDQQGNLLPTQDPSRRLSMIFTILTHRPEVAQAAVAHASEWMREYSEKDRLRRACEDLIRHVVAEYPERDQAKLFPGVAVPK